MQEKVAKAKPKKADKTKKKTAGNSISKLDPVDYAVISQGFIAAAREMGTKLVRSSYSTIVREAQDASAALFDRDGNVIAQAELIPMQLGPMSEIFRHIDAIGTGWEDRLWREMTATRPRRDLSGSHPGAS